MKRLKNCWQDITSTENLYAAWRQARKGKSHRASVCGFGLDLESRLYQLQRTLAEGDWQSGGYRQFTIYERKPRVISAAPFEDRVVHHAIMRIIEPPLDKTFVFDSYVCRKGKGVHAAVDRYQHYAQRYAWCLNVDISRYFASIDHALLKQQLTRKIACSQTLTLLYRIIDASPPVPAQHHILPGDDLLTEQVRPHGIPIGNLTSQFFANFYLNGLDHKVKEDWKIPGYIRYVDDLFLFHDDKQLLWKIHDKLQHTLLQLRLQLHPKKIQLRRCSEQMDVLGYRVSPHRRWLRNPNGYRFRRRLRGMAARYRHHHDVWFSDFAPSINAWIGHAQHAQTQSLREQMFAATVFKRADTKT